MDKTPEQKLSDLLKLIGNPATCGSSVTPGCGSPIWWVVTKAGRRLCVNPDGIPHWATCPKAREFRLIRQAERRGA